MNIIIFFCNLLIFFVKFVYTLSPPPQKVQKGYIYRKKSPIYLFLNFEQNILPLYDGNASRMHVTVLSGKAVKWQSCKASSGIPPSLSSRSSAPCLVFLVSRSLSRARSCRLFCGCSIFRFCFRLLEKQYKHFTRSGYAVAVAIFSRSEAYRTSLPTFFASRISGVSLSLSLSLGAISPMMRSRWELMDASVACGRPDLPPRCATDEF